MSTPALVASPLSAPVPVEAQGILATTFGGRRPAKVVAVIRAFQAVEAVIGTMGARNRGTIGAVPRPVRGRRSGLSSDDVLLHVSPGLIDLAFQVEVSKSLLHRVSFTDVPGIRIDHDAFHAGDGIVLEVEASRTFTGGNAFHRNVSQALLRHGRRGDVRHLVMAVPREYHFHVHRRGETQRQAWSEYETALTWTAAFYPRGRAGLPFGTTIIGY